MKPHPQAIEKGPLSGSPVMGIRVVVEDGMAHAVDSNEMAFKSAAKGAFKQVIRHAV